MINKLEGVKHVELCIVNWCGKILKKEIFSTTEWKEYIKKNNYSFNHFERYIIVDRFDSKGMEYQTLLVEEKI